MPHYDFILKNTNIIEKIRMTECFSEMWRIIDQVERISIYVFPFGKKKHGSEKLGEPVSYGRGYEPCGNIFENYNTDEMIGLERYARALAFIPGTSFMPDYKKLDVHIEDAPMSEFRFEEKKDIYVSSVMRQLWINGVRYCWEEPYKKTSRFINFYFKPEMTKLELFNLFLLAHFTIDDEPDAHAAKIQNPKPFTQQQYDELLGKKSIPKEGTACMAFEAPRDPATYLFIENKISKLAKNAIRSIEENKKPPTLEELYTTWNSK